MIVTNAHVKLNYLYSVILTAAVTLTAADPFGAGVRPGTRGLRGGGKP